MVNTGCQAGEEAGPEPPGARNLNPLSLLLKAKFPHNYKVLFISQNHNHLD